MQLSALLRPLAALLALTAAAAAEAGPWPKEAVVAKMKQESPPADDGRIVAGWRVGQVYLGMPLAELRAALGQPERTFVDGRDTFYSWRGERLGVWTSEGRVWRIHSGSGLTDEGGIERTAEGIGSRSSQMDVAVAYGPPGRTKSIADHQVVFYCYPSRGIWFTVSDNSQAVRAVGVGTKKVVERMCK